MTCLNAGRDHASILTHHQLVDPEGGNETVFKMIVERSYPITAREKEGEERRHYPSMPGVKRTRAPAGGAGAPVTSN